MSSRYSPSTVLDDLSSIEVLASPCSSSSKTADSRERYQYASCYSEENVFKMCAARRWSDEEGFAIFVGNATSTVSFKHHVKNPSGTVVWDYHVFYLSKPRGSSSFEVRDQDSSLSFPSACATYATKTFPSSTGTLSSKHLPPLFRVVPASEYLSSFSSDRSHMVKSIGSDKAVTYCYPVPSWAAIRSGAQTNNLATKFYLSANEGGAGVVMDLEEFTSHFCT